MVDVALLGSTFSDKRSSSSGKLSVRTNTVHDAFTTTAYSLFLGLLLQVTHIILGLVAETTFCRSHVSGGTLSSSHPKRS